MTDDELDRLQALADEATAGPWSSKCLEHDDQVAVYGDLVSVDSPLWEICVINIDGDRLTEFGAWEPTKDIADAAFIAASRDAVPALIAEVRRLREENERAQTR